MKKSWIIVGGIIVAVLVAFVALRAVSGFAGRTMNADGTMNIKTEEGEFTTGTSKPADWPEDAPTYPGAEVQYSGSGKPVEGEAGMAIVMMSDDSPATIGAYYKAELAKNGWKIESTMEGGATTILGATKGTRTLSLFISEADGQSAITLAVETE